MPNRGDGEEQGHSTGTTVRGSVQGSAGQGSSWRIAVLPAPCPTDYRPRGCFRTDRDSTAGKCSYNQSKQQYHQLCVQQTTDRGEASGQTGSQQQVSVPTANQNSSIPSSVSNRLQAGGSRTDRVSTAGKCSYSQSKWQNTDTSAGKVWFCQCLIIFTFVYIHVPLEIQC